MTGSGGLGIARLLVEHGVRVCVADIDASGAEDAAKHLREAGGETLAIQTDVSDRKHVDDMVARVVDEFGWPDIMITTQAWVS